MVFKNHRFPLRIPFKQRQDKLDYDAGGDKVTGQGVGIELLCYTEISKLA